jgi:acetyltransferase-like isoleucine patch superfamily enzyme
LRKLERLIAALIWQKRAHVRRKWNRALPFADHFVDRWEKAAWLGFGARSSVYDACLVLGDVKIGTDTWVGPFTVLDGSGGLEIGDHCSISAGVQIYTHDTVDWALGNAEIAYGRVKIGKNCYIGPNAVISKGVTIGDHVVIGANSFVDSDIPSNSRAWGIPCRVVGKAKGAI